MFKAVPSPYLVSDDESFRVSRAPTTPPKSAPGKKKNEEKLARCVEKLDQLQHVLFAENRWAALVVFQALDAAGKDGTIRAVLSGVNPAGVVVHSFKEPSVGELEHDFLWRTTTRLPERGRIEIFNRSYYEEVLIVRVHPKILDGQRLPDLPRLKRLWKERFESIRDHEKHLARNGVLVLKFWLNVSRAEQRRRFLNRIEDRERNWKFSAADIEEGKRFKDYMAAYQDVLRATSRSWAPWYAIPADDKPWMRVCVAEILVKSLERLDLKYPTLDAEQRKVIAEMKSVLETQR